jgi:stearoyl-CoA desaturase (delta-9 desaturase)
METRSVVVQKNAAVTSKLTLSHAKLLSSKVGFASGLLPLDYPSIFEMLFGRGCINFWLFVVLHVIAGIGLFYFSFTWKMALLVVASYYFQMFGVTGGYHRYFSHRSFKTGRAFQFVLAWLAQTSIQKGTLWWAANHRHHHKYSDKEPDPHSPLLYGFLHSHMGWFLFTEKHVPTQWEYIPDLSRYKELVWLNEYNWVPGLVYGTLMMLIGGPATFFWGFLVSLILVWHGTFTINSLSHVYGSVRYKTDDTSKNNFILAIITMGEGWHNNHHTYCSSANQGFFWYEIDMTWCVLKMLSWVGLVWDMRDAPIEELESKRVENCT